MKAPHPSTRPEPLNIFPPMWLQVQEICKSFGNTEVLNGVSFGVEKGRCLALLGPSGCGKSTILNIVAGLLPADGGRVTLGSEVLEDAGSGISVAAEKRRFSMVFQDLSLWPHMSVQENVRFGLEMIAMDDEARDEAVDQALKRTGIYNLRHRPPGTLSGGQQQRVAIARAIVVEPSVLLMDEPLAALDTRLREELRDEIAGLIRRLGITAIYVTHDHTEAMTIAHEVAIMNEGRIEQMDVPREIYDRPKTSFVASFLGSANFFPYSYELEALRHPGGARVFPPHPPSVHRGFLIVRREHVRIFPASQREEFPPDGRIQWKARCVKNSFAGERYEAHAVTRKGEIFRGYSAEPLPLDSEVIVEFDPSRVIFAER